MKSYLKFLSRNLLYTLVEAVGLILSLAFIIIIGSYAYGQWSVARQNPDYKDIYVLGMPNYFGLTWGWTDAAKDRIPEIETIARYSPSASSAFWEWQGSTVGIRIDAADKELFDIFPYIKFIEGSSDALLSRNGVIVSKSTAERYSLKLGQSVTLHTTALTIEAIIEDLDRTIFQDFDFLVSEDNELNSYSIEEPFDHYGNTVPFVKLRKGASTEEFYAKAEAVCRDVYPNFYGSAFFEKLSMTRLDKVFFTPYSAHFRRGDIGSLRMLSLVALLLLVCALFNYVNLNTALTSKRAREMATRRLLGESRGGIFLKYIEESIVFTAVCFIFALLIAIAFTPVMNTLLSNPDIPIRISFTPGSIAVYALGAVLIGCIAGAIPALTAMKSKPIDVVRGTFRSSQKRVFSKVFIIAQSTFAVVLVSMSIVMESQYRKSMSRPMHCNTEGIFFTRIIGPSPSQQLSLRDKFASLPFVKRIGFSQAVPGVLPGGQYALTSDGRELLYRTYNMDSAAFSILGFDKIKDYHTPLNHGAWFGKRTYEASGFSDDNLDIPSLRERTSGNVDFVAGEIEDFPVSNSNTGEEDYFFVCVYPMEQMYYGGWVLETMGDEKVVRRKLNEIISEWSRSHPIYEERSGFIRDFYKEGTRPMRNNMRMMEIFMVLAVLVAMLGLLAMSAYYAGENAKDIAVRKVFGGTVGTELSRSIRDYMLMVLIALVIGIPIAVWLSGRYLEQFIVKLEGYGWIFALSSVITFVMAFVSVFWQVRRAALTDPATELKKE